MPSPGSAGVADTPRRFHTLTEVAEILATSQSEGYALVRGGDLSAWGEN